MEEIRVAIELVDFLFRKFDNKIDFTGKIGIISPYREQMQKMRREFARYFGGMINKSIDFNTIDGFQGQEKEIILISCVRADDTKSSVGFLKAVSYTHLDVYKRQTINSLPFLIFFKISLPSDNVIPCAPVTGFFVMTS